MNLATMSNIKLDITKNNDSLAFAVDWLNKPFDDMIKGVGEVNRKALNTAAYIIKDKVQETFTNKMPAAGRPFNTKTPTGRQVTSKGGYKIIRNDRLVDAVRQSSATTMVTHVFMGSGESGSPLFISRMYNIGTKKRYQKTYRRVKLKRKRYLGQLSGLDYWDPGIQAGQPEAINAVNRIFEHYTEKCMENN